MIKNYVSDDLVRPKSEFTPKTGRVPELDDLSNEIEKIEIKEKPFKYNLSKKERKSLNDLRTNDITIKEADKGAAVVIMTKNYYYEMEHLRDESTYLEADLENPDKRVMEIIKEFADEYTPEVLTEKENEYICDFIPTSSKFYCLPKIHKSEEIKRIMEGRPTKYLKMSEPPSIPGRPIVGGPNCPTHKLSNLLDLTLKPLAFQVKSYVKDSFHFLEMLPKSIDFDSTFVTFEVTSLYTNIPKELGLEALSFWTDRVPESLTESRFTKEFVIAGFEIVLTFNYFMFDGKWYLQLKGVTMGTKAAVILAILTVGYLEIKLYTILPNYFSTEYTKYTIEHLKRFIDDCFITSKKNENLDLFEEILINLHPSIKFTKDTDDDRIPFLDLLVMKTAEGNIETDIFYKKQTHIDIFVLKVHIQKKSKETSHSHSHKG